MRRQPYLTSRLQGFGTNVFTEMTQLAQRHGAVNLGQGFPDSDGPEFAFYVHKEAGRHLVRFAFCKTLEVLDEGIRRLRQLEER